MVFIVFLTYCFHGLTASLPVDPSEIGGLAHVALGFPWMG